MRPSRDESSKQKNGAAAKPSNGNGGYSATAAAKAQPATMASPDASAGMMLGDRIKQARAKGYEGDPCSACGQLTLVRSGACAKCDTCGETSGCS